MTIKVTSVGALPAIVLDPLHVDFARFKIGDEFNAVVGADGVITLTPLRPGPSPGDISDTIKSTMKEYARTMKKLA